MPASGIEFDRVVADRLTRMAESQPATYPILAECVNAWMPQHAQALIAIAQHGKAPMARALTEALSSVTDPQLLATVLEALPQRTVMLRDFAVGVIRRLIALRGEADVTAASLVIRSQLGGRLREGGRPEEARAVLEPLIRSAAFQSAPALVKAHALLNLGTCYGDLAMDRESYQLHRAAIAQLQPAPADSIDHVDLIVGALANAAAAAMRFGDYDAADAALAEAQQLLPRIHDRGDLFRVRVLAFTLLAERHRFEEALQAGEPVLELLQDFEEAESETYGASLIDVLINVGSIAMDLRQLDVARRYLKQGRDLAERIAASSGAPQARWKVITACIALLNANLQDHEPGITAGARALLPCADELLRDQPTQYGNEVKARILLVLLNAATEEDDERPAKQEIESLLELTPAPQDGERVASWQRVHALHTAALAYSKLDERALALERASEAAARAESMGEGETLHDRAQRAVLADSLSRRLEEVGRGADSVAAAESALRLMVPCWRERKESYSYWLQRMMSRYHGLCGRSGERGRFERFCEDKLRLTVGFAD